MVPLTSRHRLTGPMTMKLTMQLIAVMLASLLRTAALRVPDRVIVHFDVALLAVVTCVQARALQEPHGVEGRESCIFALCSLVKPSPLRRISASSPEPMPRRRAHSRVSSATFPSTGGWLWPSRASRAWRGSQSGGSRNGSRSSKVPPFRQFV